MSGPAIGHQVGKEILESIGLGNLRYVRGFTIRCFVDEVVSVNVELFPDEDSLKTCVSTLRLFNLTPSDPVDSGWKSREDALVIGGHTLKSPEGES
jgi:hypothetical protein